MRAWLLVAVAWALPSCRAQPAADVPGAAPAPSAAAPPAPTMPPPRDDDVPPAPRADDPPPRADPRAEGHVVRVAGREVRVLEPIPGRGTAELTIAVEAEGAAPFHLELTTSFPHCERGEVDLAPVEGAPRLAFVQAFCEHGEDEFSRAIDAVVLDVGDATRPPRLLWRGDGSYGNSFDVCERIDVPTVRGVGPNRAEVVQVFEVIARPNPNRLGGGGCRAHPPRKTKVADLAF